LNPPPRPVPLPVIFENIYSDLRFPNQWVLWRYVWKEDKQKWDKPPYQPNGNLASSTASFTWSSFQDVKATYEHGLNLPVDNPKHFDGIGFVPAKSNLMETQVVFGDLDKCRNKESGDISPDVLEDLKLINSYCELSPSGTGIRFIAKGNPPFPPGKNGRKKGGIELYQSGHYLTITGHRLAEYPATIEKRPDELRAFYEKHFSEPEPEEEKSQEERGLKLTDDQIIALAAQAKNGDKFLKLMSGEWESFKKDDGEQLYPSQSEADLAFCELLAFFTTDPTQIDQIFRRSKLYREKWDRKDYCQNTINLAIERTTEHYQGDASSDSGSGKVPVIRKVSIEDINGAMGMAEDGAIRKVVEFEDENRNKKKFLAWISDCAVFIHTETAYNGETEFVFVGVGAQDKRQVKFMLPAVYLAESRKFKAALINAFGAANKVGELDFETVQKITCNTKLMKRIEIPTWDGNKPLLPGAGVADDVEYKLSKYTPASVYDGDVETAKKCLKSLLRLHKYSPILVTAILGAPAFARWHSNDRFGMALWGLTGSLKTSVVQAALSVYGTGYLDDDALLKHGKANSTQVGATEVFANAGFMPQLLDNVKTVDERDSLQYISTIHAVLEGKDKVRGRKDGGLRDSKTFNCTPIITGEIRPEEASTSARVLNLTWTRPENLEDLSYIQENASAMPVIGYHWLRFLAGTDLNLMDGFNEARSRKMSEFSQKGYTNPGRLATIYTLLRSTWGLLCETAFGDIFREFTDSFVSALNEAIETQGATVTEETEVEKFLVGLKELLASNPGLIQSKDGRTILGRVIGKWTDEGLFLLPSEVLSELAKIGVFTQKPTVDSLTKALHATGKLVVGEGQHLKQRRRMNGTLVRGWLLAMRTLDTCLFPPTGNAQNDNGRSNVPTDPTVPSENEREFSRGKIERLSETEKDLNENSGNTGNTGNSTDNSKVTDNDLIGSKDVPSGVPSGQNGRNICGIGPHPRKDAPTPGRLKAIYRPTDEALEYSGLALNHATKSEGYVKCVSCGSDITNKTQVTKNGKTYCRECGILSNPDKDCGSCDVFLKGDKSAVKCDPCSYLGRAIA